jgi:predicted 3-demethylubiquinone-9 3-methyltransferase (glyoxalase superfamily)
MIKSSRLRFWEIEIKANIIFRFSSTQQYLLTVGRQVTLSAGSSYQLDGQEFVALNGGLLFKFNEAISLFVNCESQEEVDTLWTKFTEGGEESMCGWLKDKYGLSWQIVLAGLVELLFSPDMERFARAMQYLLTMKKLDLAKIRQADEGNK